MAITFLRNEARPKCMAMFSALLFKIQACVHSRSWCLRFPVPVTSNLCRCCPRRHQRKRTVSPRSDYTRSRWRYCRHRLCGRIPADSTRRLDTGGNFRRRVGLNLSGFGSSIQIVSRSIDRLTWVCSTRDFRGLGVNLSQPYDH